MKSERLLTATRPSWLRRHRPLVGFVGVAIGLILLAQWQWLGYLVILVYVVVTLFLKWPARLAFLLGLITLAVVPIAIVLSVLPVAQNFAAYSFVFFVYGVVAMTIELRKSTGVKK